MVEHIFLIALPLGGKGKLNELTSSVKPSTAIKEHTTRESLWYLPISGTMHFTESQKKTSPELSSFLSYNSHLLGVWVGFLSLFLTYLVDKSMINSD